jgi:plasmid replication initiation protein
MPSPTEKSLLTRKKGVVIRQSNDIIEARYNFSLWEMRIFKTMLTRISAGDETFKEEVISIRELLIKYKMSDGGKVYGLVKEAATSVKSRFVNVPYLDENNHRRLKIMPLFTLIDVPIEQADGSGYIKLRFNDELKPYLIKLQSRYTSIDEEILAGMDSAYTMRIYELVKENEYKRQGEFGFEEFREIIGAKEYDEDQKVIRDVMRSWQDVKRAILNPSQKHINEHTDITFEFDKVLAEKKGPGRRKVVGILFHNIKSKINENKEKPFAIEAPKCQAETKELLDLIGDYGITNYTIENWLEKCGKQQVYNGVAYSLEKNKSGKIKDMAAYIYKMVATPDLEIAAAATDKNRSVSRKKKQEEQTQVEFEKTLEEKISQIKASFYQAKKRMVIKLIEADEKLHDNLLTTLKLEVQKTRNPITLNAFKGYQIEADLSPKEEFISNFSNNSNFAGYIVSLIERTRPDVYQETLNDYRKKVIATGFDGDIIS